MYTKGHPIKWWLRFLLLSWFNNKKKMEGPQVPLLLNQETSHDFDNTTTIIEEIKRQLRLAVPLIAVNILQYCLQVISIMFVGHLGELSLSGASMATSFASVTGFSVLVS